MPWGVPHTPEPPPEAVLLIRAADEMLKAIDAYQAESRTRFFDDVIRAASRYRLIRNSTG